MQSHSRTASSLEQLHGSAHSLPGCDADSDPSIMVLAHGGTVSGSDLSLTGQQRLFLSLPVGHIFLQFDILTLKLSIYLEGLPF